MAKTYSLKQVVIDWRTTEEARPNGRVKVKRGRSRYLTVRTGLTWAGAKAECRANRALSIVPEQALATVVAVQLAPVAERA